VAQELAMLDTPEVIPLLFGGQDKLSVDVRNNNALLSSQAARDRIQDYRDSIMERVNNGELLTPRD